MKRKFKKEPYMYSGNATLVANGTNQINLQVSSGFNFFMTKFSYVSVSAVANTIPTFDIQFLHNEKGIFDNYVAANMFPGMMVETNAAPDNRYPVGLANWFKFDVVYKFPMKSNIIINLRDSSGQANTVYIAIAGYKEIHMA